MTYDKPIFAVLMSAMLLLGGCSGAGSFFNQAAETGGDVTDKTKKDLATALDTYCEKVPQTVRLTIRGEVNEFAKKGRVKIECSPESEQEGD